VLSDFNIAEIDEELSDNDGSRDSLDEMGYIPQDLVNKMGSTRKNLFPMMEQLVKQFEGREVVKDPAALKRINKTQWGSVVATTGKNTKHHGTINVIDKDKEYQKIKNLEIPPYFKGNVCIPSLL
jgi:hypothetical protein